jgi:hypothetical protein
LEDRRSLIKELINQFLAQNSLYHKLDSETSIILYKDERNLKNHRRYKGLPYPLLTNIEYFSTAAGSWNEELLLYGIKTRAKSQEPSLSPESCGIRIHLLKQNTVNSIGNLYLKRQYSRLIRIRNSSNIRGYWLLNWQLLQRSKVFRIACLNS